MEDFGSGLKSSHEERGTVGRLIENLSLVGRHSPLGPFSPAFLATLEVLEGPEKKGEKTSTRVKRVYKDKGGNRGCCPLSCHLSLKQS